MILDPEICERARLSRDARFDGRFFIGVVTTGVYCRPVCPVSPPRRKNVRLYPCAAAAEEAGFRPCLRCRPEASPGTPAWLGTSATVSRALRRISEGALDAGGVEALAASLGVGERHLRRLFLRHVGAAPIAVAQTRRVHFAKRLIDETALPMTEVAFGAGFASIRRFNAAMRQAYGRTPRELRRRAARPDRPGIGGDLLLQLPYRPPFDWNGLVRYLRGRATPGVEAIDRAKYRRSVAIDGARGVIEVRPVRGRPWLLMRIGFPVSKGLVQIVERARGLFDLRADPREITGHLGRDPDLSPLVRAAPGLRVPGAWDGFELAVCTLLQPEARRRGEPSLPGRLAEAFGEPLPGGGAGGVRRLFPGPRVLAEADLTRLPVPRPKAGAVRALARAVRDGEIRFDATPSLDDAVSRLGRIPGLDGRTAQIIAMRAHGEPDAFPAEDRALRRAVGDGRDPLSPADLSRRAEAWRPWRAYAALYLWRGPASRRRVRGSDAAA